MLKFSFPSTFIIPCLVFYGSLFSDTWHLTPQSLLCTLIGDNPQPLQRQCRLNCLNRFGDIE